MTASTILLSKISRTKKRLSDDPWQMRFLVVLVLGLFIILSFALRSTWIAGSYGIVEAEIPAVSVQVEDPSESTYRESPRAAITKTTPIVILTDQEFYFGDLEAFGGKFSDVRNKFFVKHAKGGAPNVVLLNEMMAKWLYQRSQESIGNDGIVVLLPDRNVPAPIVIQTIAGLKDSPYFNQVVLASGIM